MNPQAPCHPAPFIVGAPRSGTTLLRFMLDAHPALAIPPETGFIPAVLELNGSGDALRDCFFETVTGFPPGMSAWADFKVGHDELLEALQAIEPFRVDEGVRCFYRLYAARFGKTLWGDKTPFYSHSMAAIARLLPEARFIHLVRDGRDVALSLRKTWFAPGQDMASLAKVWLQHVGAARVFAASAPHRCLEIRYESLIGDAERELCRLCEFLELPFAAGMLTYHERVEARLQEHEERRREDGTLIVTKEQRLQQQFMTRRPPARERIGRWRETMTADECRDFQRIAGELLEQLGYPLD